MLRMASYQWIVTFTTTSTTLPTRPSLPTVQSMLSNLFDSPTNVWLAGPQSVDDGPAADGADGPTQVVYQWMISLLTTNTNGPTMADLETELEGVFGSTVANVWLAGPQSVDDGPVEKSDG